jgi:glyoxylase-like metal-dependent hydrolase (beta-lactamase superfamily II)
MLQQITQGVLVDQSALLANNCVVVVGESGVLVVDPGQTRTELVAIAASIRTLGLPVVAGFSTHPHWDHVLWHSDLGSAPRYGTARGAADMAELLASDDWKTRVAEHLPEDIADQVPLELFGRITALPDGSVQIPWDGPDVRVLAHTAHSAGHAALFIEDRGVLVAGDMLSDMFPPMLDFGAEDAIGDYLAGLDILESVADDVRFVVPGHGTVGDAREFRSRLDLDRACVVALRDGTQVDDPRITSPKPGWEWVRDVFGPKQ